MKNITRFTAILVVALAGGAFLLSFESLRGLAAANSVPFPSVFPLIIEGFIIVASLAWLRGSINGEAVRYPVALIILATAVSVAFNIIHAPANWLARAMFAVPPLALLAAFELLMAQLKAQMVKPDDTDWQGQLVNVQGQLAAVKTEWARLKDESEELQGQLAAAHSERAQLQASYARLQKEHHALQAAETVPPELGPLGVDLLQLVAGRKTATEIASEYEISESTVSRLRGYLNGGVKR